MADNKRYHITISDPCDQDWSVMTPNEKGKFCSKCKKSVNDFTDKSDEDVQRFLSDNLGKRICGRFRNDQLSDDIRTGSFQNPVVIPAKAGILKISQEKYFLLPKFLFPLNFSPVRTLIAALLVFFGSILQGFDKGSQDYSFYDRIGSVHPTRRMDTLGGITIQQIAGDNPFYFLRLAQYTKHSVTNPFDVPLKIMGIASIPPRQSKTFITDGQDEIEVKAGKLRGAIHLMENEKPSISFTPLIFMNPEGSVSELQKNPAYRIEIRDDFPEQLEVNFSGPVKVREIGKMKYEATLNKFGSEQTFEKYITGRTEPYSLKFTVTVTDKIAKHRETRDLYFTFGEW